MDAQGNYQIHIMHDVINFMLELIHLKLKNTIWDSQHH